MLVPSIHERKSWLGLLLAIVVGLNLYFSFSVRSNPEERADWLDSVFAKAILPFHYLMAGAQSGVTGMMQSAGELVTARSENRELKSELQAQQLELHLLEELRLENQRLRDLLGFRKRQPLNYLASKVIGKDPSPFFKSLILDRGSKDGVEENMPVVSIDGVVGRIIDSGHFSSKVLLISDMNSRVDAVVSRSRTRAIVAGSSIGKLGLRFLPRRQDVLPDDILVTSGLGGVFPSGFEVGRIISLNRDPNEVLERAEILPSVDFDAIEEVFIVKNEESGHAR